MIISDWSKLNELSASILEIVDITGRDLKLEIGDIFETRFIKGIVTESIANEIVEYQSSKENEGYTSAEIKDNTLYIKFLKRCL